MYYRLYIWGENSRVKAVEAFEAPDDDCAIAIAERVAAGRKELWCEKRLVKQWMLESETGSRVP